MVPPRTDDRQNQPDEPISERRPDAAMTCDAENTPDEAAQKPLSLPHRLLYMCLGFIMLGLGIIGAILPVMPTTIFIILAAWFFARSSPRLEARILAHKQFGPLVVKWRDKGAIPRRAKKFAVGGMIFGYVMFFWGAQPGWLFGLAVALFMLASALYVISRPEE